MYTRMIPAITQSMQSYTRHPALGSRQHVQTQRKEEKHNAKPCKHKGIVMVPYNDSCYIYNSYILLHHRPWLCHFQKQTSISRSPQSLPPVPVKLHAPQLKRSANKTHPHRITSYCYRRSRVFASFINTIVKYQWTNSPHTESKQARNTAQCSPCRSKGTKMLSPKPTLGNVERTALSRWQGYKNTVNDETVGDGLCFLPRGRCLPMPPRRSRRACWWMPCTRRCYPERDRKTVYPRQKLSSVKIPTGSKTLAHTDNS